MKEEGQASGLAARLLSDTESCLPLRRSIDPIQGPMPPACLALALQSSRVFAGGLSQPCQGRTRGLLHPKLFVWGPVPRHPAIPSRLPGGASCFQTSTNRRYPGATVAPTARAPTLPSLLALHNGALCVTRLTSTRQITATGCNQGPAQKVIMRLFSLHNALPSLSGAMW